MALGMAASSRDARGSGHWHHHTAWGLGTVGTAPSARPPLAPTRSRPLPVRSHSARPFQSGKEYLQVFGSSLLHYQLSMYFPYLILLLVADILHSNKICKQCHELRPKI